MYISRYKFTAQNPKIIFHVNCYALTTDLKSIVQTENRLSTAFHPFLDLSPMTTRYQNIGNINISQPDNNPFLLDQPER